MSALTGEWERALHEEFSKEYYKNYSFLFGNNIVRQLFIQRQMRFLRPFISRRLRRLRL